MSLKYKSASNFKKEITVDSNQFLSKIQIRKMSLFSILKSFKFLTINGSVNVCNDRKHIKVTVKEK